MRTAIQAGAVAALVLSCLSAPSISRAGPSDYVILPLVEYGEKEIDFKAGSAKLRDGTRESLCRPTSAATSRRT
jgi:hypothetical protein